MNIHQRIHAVMEAISGVAPDKTIGEGRYAYDVVTYNAIVGNVRKLIVGNRILVTASQVGPGRMVPTGTFYGAKNGSPGIEAMRYEAMYEVAFINIDDPADRVVEMFEAHSLDQGDKAPGKAQTYATKACLKKVLLLSNEEDEDDETRQNVTGGNGNGQAPISEPQAKSGPPAGVKAEGAKSTPKSNGKPASAGEIAWVTKKAGERSGALLKHLGIESLDKMTGDHFAAAKTWLNAKAA